MGVYRGHEGTVYAIDAFYKYHPNPINTSNPTKVSPCEKDGNAVIVATGTIYYPVLNLFNQAHTTNQLFFGKLQRAIIPNQNQ